MTHFPFHWHFHANSFPLSTFEYDASTFIRFWSVFRHFHANLKPLQTLSQSLTTTKTETQFHFCPQKAFWKLINMFILLTNWFLNSTLILGNFLWLLSSTIRWIERLFDPMTSRSPPAASSYTVACVMSTCNTFDEKLNWTLSQYFRNEKTQSQGAFPCCNLEANNCREEFVVW